MSAHGHTAALRSIRALLATEDARGWNASGLHMTVDACRSVCEEALEAPRAPHGAGGSRVEGSVERRGAEGKPPPAAPGRHCTATEVCFPCRDREAHPKPEPPWLGPDAVSPSAEAPDVEPATDDLLLLSGAHDSPNEGMCVMEAVAWVAGEPHSDQPTCACPVISEFLRRWNDDLPDDETRTRLLAPLVPRIVGSRSAPEVEDRRAWLATDWLVRECAPAWLRAAGLMERAERLEGLAPVISPQAARDQQPHLEAAGAAAWDAAGPAAWDAAWDAAGAAAGNAARNAARNAAWAAARNAAGAAAWAAARNAAGNAAGAAAGAALAPTTEALQRSALALVDRMLAVTPDTIGGES